MLRPLAFGLLAFTLTACVDAGDDTGLGTHTQAAGNTVPWQHPAQWPYSIESPRIVVHYQATADLAMAQTVQTAVEHAWAVQVTEQGARAPLDDGGAAGSDGRFDVYLDRGIDSLYVASVAANPATPYDDYSTAMVLDPWGQYGGAELAANVFHEFRHASQGADDWNEHIEVFEAEATFWETQYYGYARLPYVWADYQAHPEWTPFKDDRYRTWFMYGGAMFWLYLRGHVFADSMAFANQVWAASRNPAGTNEPDFADALDGVLAVHGTTLFDQLVAFDRARWYTGARADGTLESGAILPDVAATTHTRASGAGHTTFQVGPQLLGTVYTVVKRAPTDGTTARVSLVTTASGSRPVIQLVGQGASDRILALTAGGASTTVPYVNGQAVIAVTMLPASGAFDPDTVGTQAIKATIAIDP